MAQNKGGNVSAGYWDNVSEFKWEIDNFCCMGCQGVGYSLSSPNFTTRCSIGDIEWYLKMYPSGKNDKCKEYVSLTVHSNVEIFATVTLIIFNNKGQVMASRTLNYLFGRNKGCGYNKFILRSLICCLENGILDNGKLSIMCEIKCASIEIESSFSAYHEEDQFENDDSLIILEEDYRALLNDDRFSDVLLVSEGKTVRAHKCVLAGKSVVFAAMFNAEMKEKKENVVEIPDINHDVLVEMVRYIYTRNVVDIDKLAGELIVAADKYALHDLKVKCEWVMIEHLDDENVLKCLQVADKLNVDDLKESAIKFILEKANDVIDKPEFDLLPRNIYREIIRRSFVKNVK